MPHVLSVNGWEAMRWDRWSAMNPIDGNWGVEVLDTSRLTPVQVADEILTWCRRTHRQSDHLASRGRVNEIDLPYPPAKTARFVEGSLTDAAPGGGLGTIRE
jgi:hypothetical protein